MRAENVAALALGAGVVLSLGASGLSGALFSTSIGTVSREHTLAITPRSGAFSIWGVIYTLLAASAVFASAQEVALTPALTLAAAEALTAAWVPLFLANTPASLVGAAAVLVAAAALGTAAVFGVGPLRSLPWQRALCVQTSFALFTGWLWCAALLSVGIAARPWVATPQWALPVLAGLVGTLAAASRNPVLVLPCAWALLWQPETVGSAYTLSGLLLCVAGGAAAVALPP